MNTTNQIETRTLGKYIKAKLGCSIAAFATSQNIPAGTLNTRWKSLDGRKRVQDMVFRVYVKRFDEL